MKDNNKIVDVLDEVLSLYVQDGNPFVWRANIIEMRNKYASQSVQTLESQLDNNGGVTDKFWFDQFNERHPDEVSEIMESEDYNKSLQSSASKQSQPEVTDIYNYANKTNFMIFDTFWDAFVGGVKALRDNKIKHK
jgi:hypothetical protein